MTKKITMGLVAAAAITAFAFTAPTEKHLTTYSVDTKATTATWLGKKVTGQHDGKINVSKGSVINDHNTITGGTIEFDMNSITCTDLTDKEWNDKLIGHLKSDDFFSSAKNPTAKFEITKVAPIETLKPENDFNVTGKLTIKGITNEITFPAKIKMDEKTMVVIAKIIINRTKFDIKYGSASFFESIGDKAISDDFELNVNLVAGTK
ncbi:MAG: YceI family protein [Bacteroidota bacterium]